jgi:hypothetical protein
MGLETYSKASGWKNYRKGKFFQEKFSQGNLKEMVYLRCALYAAFLNIRRFLIYQIKTDTPLVYSI